MNKIIIFVLILISVNLNAQDHINIKAGYGLTSHIAKMRNVTSGLTLGVEIEIESDEQNSFLLAFEYKEKGIKYLVVKKNILEEKIQYLNVSFGHKWWAAPKLFLSSGAFMGFLIDNEITKELNDPEDQYFNSYSDNTSDEFGLYFNLGISSPDRKLYGYVQYDVGLVNIKGIQNGIKSKTNTISFVLVYRIP